MNHDPERLQAGQNLVSDLVQPWNTLVVLIRVLSAVRGFEAKSGGEPSAFD